MEQCHQPNGIHYFGWNGNQIYYQQEGRAFVFARNLSGGKGKDAFAFRKDGRGFFFSGAENGKIYWFSDPSKYSTVQVQNADGNASAIFSANHKPIDLAFDADDRAFFLDASGNLWVAPDTSGTTWIARYITRFASARPGASCSYFGIAFDAQGAVYLCGGINDGTNDRRFIAKSSLDKPEVVEMIYEGPPGSGSYGNLASRVWPRVNLSV